MDPVILSSLGGLIAILFTGMGYFIQDALASSKRTAEKLAEFRTEVARDYVSRSTLDSTERRIIESLSEIKVDLQRIFEKLDRKADK